MYGEGALTAGLGPEVAGRPLAWAVTGAVVVTVVGVLAVVRACSKRRRSRAGG